MTSDGGKEFYNLIEPLEPGAWRKELEARIKYNTARVARLEGERPVTKRLVDVGVAAPASAAALEDRINITRYRIQEAQEQIAELEKNDHQGTETP